MFLYFETPLERQHIHVFTQSVMLKPHQNFTKYFHICCFYFIPLKIRTNWRRHSPLLPYLLHSKPNGLHICMLDTTQTLLTLLTSLAHSELHNCETILNSVYKVFTHVIKSNVTDHCQSNVSYELMV